MPFRSHGGTDRGSSLSHAPRRQTPRDSSQKRQRGLSSSSLALKAREINPAGRKRVIRDKRWPFRKHDREIGVLHRRSIECAKVPLHWRRQPLACAEAFLASEKGRQLGSQLALVLIEKADKTAEMVVMAVREDERVDFAWIEGKQGDIVIERLWRVTKINEDVARLRSCLRRRMQGQTKLARDGFARRLIAQR